MTLEYKYLFSNSLSSDRLYFGGTCWGSKFLSGTISGTRRSQDISSLNAMLSALSLLNSSGQSLVQINSNYA